MTLGGRFDDGDGYTMRDGDYTSSDEAMKVLVEQGVEAWQAWCEQHAPDSGAGG